MVCFYRLIRQDILDDGLGDTRSTRSGAQLVRRRGGIEGSLHRQHVFQLAFLPKSESDAQPSVTRHTLRLSFLLGDRLMFDLPISGKDARGGNRRGGTERVTCPSHCLSRGHRRGNQTIFWS